MAHERSGLALKQRDHAPFTAGPAGPKHSRTERSAPRPARQDLADGQLVTLALNGDRQAFPVLLDRYLPKLRRVVAKRVFIRDEAEDIVQETLAAAWGALQSYPTSRPFEAWLVFIAVNKCRDLGRRRAVRQRAAPYLLELEPAAEPDAEAGLIENERHAEVRRALALMPQSLRGPLMLMTVDGASQKEAALALGLTVKGVEMRVRRARHWLRGQLEAVPC